MPFTNKKVIVTGANRSMGREMALMFAKNGADVVISYRSDSKGAEETIAAIQATGRKAYAIQTDFSDSEQVSAFAQQAMEHLGHIDILVNNAAMKSRENMMDLSLETMQQVLQVNTIAPWYLAQLCAKNMVSTQTKGCIINISSIAASTTMQQGIAYAASKAAMNKWTQNAALNLATHSIRVNAIAPGVIESGMNQERATTNPEFWQKHTANIPLQRAGTPTDIANMALFLASEQANWITGKIFEVDGGHVL